MTEQQLKRVRGGASRYVLAAMTSFALAAALWPRHVRPPSAGDAPAASFAAPLAAAVAGPAQKLAARVARPEHAPLLAATRAGARIVAVGDHGVVLLSDDEGQSFRQARAVPSQALLTSVCFVDSQQGWIAGHDGVILHTRDGGETWNLQREDLDGDKPLFAVLFQDALHGFAVGLFGTAIRTADGGESWMPLTLEDGPENDRHLYAIFGDARFGLFVAGESGLIYRSDDGGTRWSAIRTGNPGSFWSGARLTDGTLLAAGQRGHVYRSRDRGLSWSEVPSGTLASLTSVVPLAQGGVLITGLAGASLISTDGGRSFTVSLRDDRAPLTAALTLRAGEPLLFGSGGVLAR
jgi:photosystem II stability/assembly factor-like uncharacterized protein